MTPQQKDIYKAFLDAIEAEDLDAMKKLLSRGQDPNFANILKRTPLFTAIEKKNDAMIDLLLSYGADTKICDSTYLSPFDAAIDCGYSLPELEALYRKGIKPQSTSRDRTTLHIAVGKKRHDLLPWLFNIAPDLNINAKDRWGDTALHIAVEDHQPQDMCVRTLLRMGASPFVVDKSGLTPLSICVNENKQPLLKRLLRDSNMVKTIDVPDDDNMTPLGYAVVENDLVMINDLIAAGAAVNSNNDEFIAPILVAIKEGHVEALKILLEKGGADVAAYQRRNSEDANFSLMPNICTNNYTDEGYEQIVGLLARYDLLIDEQDGTGDSELSNACRDINLFKIETLLSHGANPNVINANGMRAHDLVMLEGLEMMYGKKIDKDVMTALELLYQAGADPNRPDHEFGIIPLSYAIEGGAPSLVSFLLSHNANPNVRDDLGDTPLYTAAACGDLKSFEALLNAGADIGALNDEKHTILHAAAAGKNADIIKKIIASGKVDIHAKDDTGMTAMHYAFAKDGFDAVVALFEAGADINAKDHANLTPAQHLMTYKKETRIMAALRVAAKTEIENIVHAIDWNVKSTDGRGMLHNAIHENLSDKVNNLLKVGADVLLKDDYGMSAVHHAILTNREGLSMVLLKHICQNHREAVNTHVDARGWTLLHYAAKLGSMPAVAALLAHGANPNVPNMAGDTPLHIAARFGHTNMTHAMKVGHADGTIANHNGRRAFEIAAARGHHDLAETLKPKNPDNKL